MKRRAQPASAYLWRQFITPCTIFRVGFDEEVVVEAGRSYFDTNTDDHHHFFHEHSGQLEDIPSDQINVSELPSAPPGTSVSRVDVIVRVSGSAD